MSDHKVRADHIKKLRKRKMWNQTQLAEAAGMSLGQISRVEQGRHNPHLSSVVKIAHALDVDANTLVIWTDAPDRKPAPEETPENTKAIDDVHARWDKLDEEADKE